MIKFDVGANSPSLNLLSGSMLNWLGTPYRPVVLTARHDHSVGQPLSVPAGTLSGYYANTALKLDNLGVVTLTNLSLRHAALGIDAIGNTALTLRHAQFVNCGTAVKNGLAVTLQNALFHSVANVLWQTGSTGSTGEFITVDSAQYANYATSGGTLTLKNSILANVVNPNTGVIPPNTFIATLPIFATAGAGAHYLDVDKAWVQAANVTGTIAAPLNSELVGMTVRPPGVLPAAVTSDLTLPALPIAEGTDPAKWRWGYHYWPVHYLAPGTIVTGATVTLTNGVVVAGTEGTAFMLASGGKFSSTGRPDALDRLVYASTVQEQPSAVVPNLTARRFLDVATGTPAVRPEVRLRFTAMDYPADAASRRALLNVDNRFVGVTDIRDSQFRGVKFTLAPAASPSPAQTVTFVNNLWQTCDVTVYRFYDANLPAVLRNNLFNGGNLSLQYTSFGSNPSWTVRDNLFDGTTLGTSIPGASLVAGWNGYSAATALFGGSGNVLNLVTVGSGGYQVGPLGAFYYPATGTGLNTLRNAGSQSAANAGLYHHTTRMDQTKDSADDSTKVDIGFHYVATTGSASTTPVDTDADTLPDYLEDADGSGAQNGTETAWQNADSDADGALDNEEIAGGTDPLSKASWIPKRLAYWSFDGTGTTPPFTKLGDRGQAPIVDLNGTPASGVVNNGIHFGAGGALKFAIREGNGRLNLRMDQGSVRLWFKPDWTVTSPTVRTAPSLPRLLEVGAYGSPTLGWWAWHFDATTQAIDNPTGLALKMAQVTLPIMRMPLRLSDPETWTQPSWHELDLTYMAEGAFATDVQQNGLNLDYVFPASTYYGGNPVTVADLPPESTWSTQGFALGTDISGSGIPLNGTMDSVETFNYSLGGVELVRRQQLTAQATSATQLTFSRTYEGASQTIGSGMSKPWPLTLSRRALHPTTWTPTTAWATVLAASTAETFSDTTATGFAAGTAYEYRADFDYDPSPATAFWPRHFVAGVEMPPQHYRGHVILLVEGSLIDPAHPEWNLSAEIAALKQQLVGDGWSVKQLSAPRHIDEGDPFFTANKANRIAVSAMVRDPANQVINVPNVVFILGHVTIPYSGTEAHDGHTIDHKGAWVCDAYYGYKQDLVNGEGWTDTLTINTANNYAVAGDGKFDQSFLMGGGITPAPGVNRLPDFAVGRIDFARMPAFGNSFSPQLTDIMAIEVAMIKRYLAKDFKYRANGVPTFGRVSAFGEPFSKSSQSFAGAAFGIEPGRLFTGYNLRHKVPADLGVHYRSGDDDQVESGINDGMGETFYSTSFADAAKEIPVTFRNVWFSYASDWARLNPENSFVVDNNFLRASLGWPNYGLATVGGTYWDFSPLGAGRPLAETMTRAWQSQLVVPAFEGILGDPTVRLFRVSPPQNVRHFRNGSTVTLAWDSAAEPGIAYYVYRSGSNTGVDGFVLTPNPLNTVKVQGTSFTDTAASGANLTYQVRATKLQATGSGSFWNLSQGTFVTVP